MLPVWLGCRERLGQDGPGGRARKLTPPAGAHPVEGNGKVLVQLLMGTQGSITSTSVIKSVGPTYDADVMRTVAALPRWQPGMLKGEPTVVRFSMHVVLK